MPGQVAKKRVFFLLHSPARCDFRVLITEQVQNSIAVYNSDELDVDESGDDGNVVLKDWRTEGKKQLDEARESLRYLCEPVPPPRH